MVVRQSSKNDGISKTVTVGLSNQEIAFQLVKEFIKSQNLSHVDTNLSAEEAKASLSAKADLDSYYIVMMYYRTLNLMYDTQHWYKNIS